jgi:hypothetical protein
LTTTDPRITPAQAKALHGLAQFPLVEALLGRRSRRFAVGDEIPDGPLAYRSRHDPVPLTELERLLVLGAMGGTITRNGRYAPHLATYAGTGGRAHLPVGGRLPHRRAVLDRRLRDLVLPDPGRWSTRPRGR